MVKKLPAPVRYVQPCHYASPYIPLSAIRRFARQIAGRFHPDKIILFGSYAYGQPHEESDVDLLVIMPAYDVVNQAIRISGAFSVLRRPHPARRVPASCCCGVLIAEDVPQCEGTRREGRERRTRLVLSTIRP